MCPLEVVSSFGLDALADSGRRRIQKVINLEVANLRVKQDRYPIIQYWNLIGFPNKSLDDIDHTIQPDMAI